MPVIHVTVPSWMHEELQELASEMGLSVSGLVKLFIKEGLERIREERRSKRREELEVRDEKVLGILMELASRVEQLQRIVEERLTSIEGDLYRVRIQVNNLRRRVARLEDMVEDKIMPVEVDTSDVYQTA